MLLKNETTPTNSLEFKREDGESPEMTIFSFGAAALCLEERMDALLYGKFSTNQSAATKVTL